MLVYLRLQLSFRVGWVYGPMGTFNQIILPYNARNLFGISPGVLPTSLSTVIRIQAQIDSLLTHH